METLEPEFQSGRNGQPMEVDGNRRGMVKSTPSHNQSSCCILNSLKLSKLTGPAADHIGDCYNNLDAKLQVHLLTAGMCPEVDSSECDLQRRNLYYRDHRYDWVRPGPNAAPLMCRTKLNKVRL